MPVVTGSDDAGWPRVHWGTAPDPSRVMDPARLVRVRPVGERFKAGDRVLFIRQIGRPVRGTVVDPVYERGGTVSVKWDLPGTPRAHPSRLVHLTSETNQPAAENPPQPQPTVGQTVHYVSFGTPGGESGKRCRAATITEVGAWITTSTQVMHREEGSDRSERIAHQHWDPEACALMVANPTGLFSNTCPHREPDGFSGQTDGVVSEVSPNVAGGTWHWAEHRP